PQSAPALCDLRDRRLFHGHHRCAQYRDASAGLVHGALVLALDLLAQRGRDAAHDALHLPCDPAPAAAPRPEACLELERFPLCQSRPESNLRCTRAGRAARLAQFRRHRLDAGSRSIPAPCCCHPAMDVSEPDGESSVPGIPEHPAPRGGLVLVWFRAARRFVPDSGIPWGDPELPPAADRDCAPVGATASVCHGLARSPAHAMDPRAPDLRAWLCDRCGCVSHERAVDQRLGGGELLATAARDGCRLVIYL